MAARWKQSYIRPPPSYIIVLPSSVKILEVKDIEFHRIGPFLHGDSPLLSPWFLLPSKIHWTCVVLLLGYCRRRWASITQYRANVSCSMLLHLILKAQFMNSMTQYFEHDSLYNEMV